jgi:hypothetical protein
MWFSTLLLNASVRRVKPRMPNRMEKVLRFHVASADIRLVGDDAGRGPDAFSGAITALSALGSRTVVLHQHGVVDVIAKGPLRGVQIRLGPSDVSCKRLANRSARSRMNTLAS